MITARMTRDHRACQQTPAVEIFVVSLRRGMDGSFGPELRRFVLTAQVTAGRLVVQPWAVGASISRWQVMHLPIDEQNDFLTEICHVLHTGHTGCVVTKLARFVDQVTWRRHRAVPGIADLRANSTPVRVTIEDAEQPCPSDMLNAASQQPVAPCCPA